ncbi:family transcriptional regulator, putative [Babesia caballi]|uniref:Family transcriptional regulator, putative n=1 Tax=Babesia caballi TaxID=5871 RepID=A0AAV4LW46_BABCB|nr:family transcriptional regulator, putative [Babesia caballi]
MRRSAAVLGSSDLSLERLVRTTVGVAQLAELKRLDDAQRVELDNDLDVVELKRLLGLVGLHTTDEVRAPDGLVGRRVHALHQLGGQHVFVLEDEVLRVVLDAANRVDDGEVELAADLGRRVLVVGLQLVVARGHEVLVGAAGGEALILEQRQNGLALGAEHLNDGRVGRVVELGDGNALVLVESRLALEDNVHEVGLKHLVGDVDEELLEGVVLEHLEAENVKHANEVLEAALGLNGTVEVADQPQEQTLVHGLADAGPEHIGVANLPRSANLVAAGAGDFDGELSLQLGRVEEQQPTSVLEHVLVDDGRRVVDAVHGGGADLDVAHQQDTGQQGEDGADLVLREAHALERLEHLLEVGNVVDGGHIVALGVEELVLAQPLELVLGLHLRRGALNQLVEDVVRALRGILGDDARLLEQEGDDGAVANATLLGHVELHETPETRRVVVSDGLGVTEGLKHGVGSHDGGLDAAVALAVAVEGEVAHHLLGGLGLTGAGLAGDDDCLRKLEVVYILQSMAGGQKDVRSQFHGVRRLLVATNDLVGGVAQVLEGVDGHQQRVGGAVYLVVHEAVTKVVKHARDVRLREHTDVAVRHGVYLGVGAPGAIDRDLERGLLLRALCNNRRRNSHLRKRVQGQFASR